MSERVSPQNKQFTAVVPAAGVGSRMQADKPKQYLPLLGNTVLENTLERLISHPDINRVVLAVSPDDVFIKQLPVYQSKWLQVVNGGTERSDSVLNGIAHVEDDWVLVHDAARPCVRHSDITQLLKLADGDAGGILAKQATDTMKLATGNSKWLEIKESVDRSLLWHALTPQLFPTQQLREALIWCARNQTVITDEASAIESTGGKALLVPGQADNIKITHPGDLALAEFYLQQQTREITQTRN